MTERQKKVGLTVLIGRRGLDSRGKQRRADEDVKRLVPVGGAGQDGDRPIQELLLWRYGAERPPQFSSCFEKKGTPSLALILCRFIVFGVFCILISKKTSVSKNKIVSNLDPEPAGLVPQRPSPDLDGGKDWRKPPRTEPPDLKEDKKRQTALQEVKEEKKNRQEHINNFTEQLQFDELPFNLGLIQAA